MSIVKALNDLSGKDAKTIEKAIRNIDLGGGGGGSGSGGMLVTFSLSINQDAQANDNPYIITADKTFSEIVSAYDDGQIVEGVLDLSSAYQSKYLLPMELVSVSTAELWFSNLTSTGSNQILSGFTNYQIAMTSSDTVNFEVLTGNIPDSGGSGGDSESEFFNVNFTKNGSTISCTVTSDEVYDAANLGKKIYATLNGTPLTRIKYAEASNNYINYIGVEAMIRSSTSLESITGMKYIIINLSGSTVTYVEKTISFDS